MEPKKCASADRAEWLKARAEGVGSSDAAAIIGVSRWKSALDVWADKTGASEPEPDNRFLEAGRFLEPAIAAWFTHRTGIVLEDPGDFTIFCEADAPWRRCTPDRFIRVDGNEDALEMNGLPVDLGPGVLEIKEADRWVADQWEDGEPPLQYQVQVQHQLGVMGLDWGVICVLIGGNELRWFFVGRHEPFIAALRSKVDDFWTHVQTGVEPKADLPRDVKTWELLHRGEEDMETDLDASFEALDDQIQDARGNLKRTQDYLASLEAKLKVAIGDATLARLPNGVVYTYKTINIDGKTIVRKPYSYRRLNRRKPK